MKKVKYSDIRDELQNGDLIIMSGKGWISKAIQFFTGSPASHVGMIYRAPEGPVLLFESTTLQYMPGHDTKGVRLIEMSKTVANYKGRIFLRRLSEPLDFGLYEAVRNQYKNTPYESNMMKLLSAGTPWTWRKKKRWGKRAQRTIFCSELVALVLQALGKINGGMSPEEYAPEHFFENNIPWKGGFTAAPAIEIESI